MKKYLIFAMLLLAVLACKPKQKPGGRGVISGGGGLIKPPTIETQDEATIKTVFTSIAVKLDASPKGWQTSDWVNEPRLTERDIGKITDGGFFVSQYSTENWIVFAINSERNIYTGLSKGPNKLQEALAMLSDEKGNLKEEAWDPRKLLFNQVQDKEDPERLLSIAWLGRAMWDEHYTDQENTSYRDYDSKYANALQYLQSDAKTYGTLRNYKNELYYDWITDPELQKTEGYSWGKVSTFPLEDALGNDRRKVWAYFLFDPNNNSHVQWELPGPRYTNVTGGYTRVSLLRGMRFAYAGPEGGYPGGSSQFNTNLDYFNLGKRGTKAVPKDAKWEDRVDSSRNNYGTNGKYHDGYNNMFPRGKIVFDRDPINHDPKGARVLFLSTVVAYNLRMRDAKDPNAGGLFGGNEYNVKEVIFEFDAASFEDVTGDRFSADDLPIRQNASKTDEIIANSEFKTHKMPLLYFSPK